MHIGKVVDGAYKVGDTVSSSVEYGTRHDIIPNHTMTHVLNLALRYLIFCFLVKIISSSWIKLFVPEFYVFFPNSYFCLKIIFWAKLLMGGGKVPLRYCSNFFLFRMLWFRKSHPIKIFRKWWKNAFMQFQLWSICFYK